MTITEPNQVVGGPKLKKVVFTHDSAAVASENATTTIKITGLLLAVLHTGGDAVWNFVLNNGTADIFTSGNLDNTTLFKTLALQFDGSQQDAATENVLFGIPMVNETLKCTTTNVSTLAPTITVYYKED